ncbi:hypothetical protein [Sulfobacillus harzensis]|uniref:Uncharacterized protein n=1 Tax=Sulfobacillus harzensis TaxID=2729629 RepID=A0A7Y0L5M8_9FIRM|nr:hypothetical protein [Sulfobacillus harzensis]NMP23744.1 hypothetical protein [Sulfobacillus harzensis]
MSSNDYGMPPEDQAIPTVQALIRRSKTIRRSALQLREDDLRTAFFLATIALEEVMQGYLVWSYGIGLGTRDQIIQLMNTDSRHKVRQRLAIGLLTLLEVTKPTMRKITHKKTHYEAVRLAGKTVSEVFAHHREDLTMDKLGEWDTLKMQCMYVDWIADKGLIDMPVIQEDLDTVMNAVNRLLNQLMLFMSRDARRRISRHRQEFQQIIQDLRLTYALN